MRTDGNAKAKRGLRREMRARLASIGAEERARASADACALVEAYPGFGRASTVMLYAALPDEIDAGALIGVALGAGKRVALPRMEWDAGVIVPVPIESTDFPTETRRFGVAEPVAAGPVEPGSIDLVVVPGLAFDRAGGRLGRGKGFYDRFLATLPGSAFRLGLAFDAQIVERIPTDPHDQRVDAIATPTCVVAC